MVCKTALGAFYLDCRLAVKLGWITASQDRESYLTLLDRLLDKNFSGIIVAWLGY
jgi:hypothetical protein